MVVGGCGANAGEADGDVWPRLPSLEAMMSRFTVGRVLERASRRYVFRSELSTESIRGQQATGRQAM